MPRPCFSRNHSNYYAVAPYCFFKDHFVARGCPIFIIFFSVCCSFYLFISKQLSIHFHNTTVNVEPLSPTNFEKIAPYLKSNVFSYFGSLRLLFYFLIFLLLFGYPLLPPGQNAQILIVLGAIVSRCWCRFCRFVFEVSFPKTSSHKRMKPETTTNL